MGKEALNPNPDDTFANYIEETIFGVNIAVQEGRMTPSEGQQLVGKAIFWASVFVLLGLPLDTSTQTKGLEEIYKGLKAA